MPTTFVSLKPRRGPSISSEESPTRSRTSNRPAQSTRKQQRNSRLDNPHWRPYRNSNELAQQVYDLTHPENAQAFAELAREADLARELEPYWEAVVHLSAF